MTSTPNINQIEVVKWWKRFKEYPGGKWFFSKAIGWIVPYAGKINPQVMMLGNGRCQIKMPFARKIQNHISIVHGAALVNLMELTASLAFLSRKDNINCIVMSVQTDFVRPGLTDVFAYCDVSSIDLKSKTEAIVKIKDISGKLVARGKCTWKVRGLNQWSQSPPKKKF